MAEDEEEGGGGATRVTVNARLPTQQLSRMVGARLGIPEASAAYVMAQVKQGATVPFLSRYRQDETGHLDEDQIRAVVATAEEVAEVHRRRQFMLTSLAQRGLLTDDIRDALARMVHVSQLEDFWEPFKVRKTSLAARARDAGLAPLAEALLHQTASLPHHARKTINGIEDGERLFVALIAEELQRHEPARQRLLAELQQAGFFASSIVKSARKKSAKELREDDFAQLKKKYQFYDQKRYSVRTVNSHTVLALLRGEAKGVLKLDFQCGGGRDPMRVFQSLVEGYFPGVASRKAAGRDYNRHRNEGDGGGGGKGPSAAPSASTSLSQYSSYEMSLLNNGLKAAYDYLWKSAVNTIRRDIRKSAEREAIVVFAHNLRHMLLQRPLAHARVLAMDPGISHGVKCVALDEAGDVIAYFKCSLLEENRMMEYIAKIVETKKLNKIVIGNGTASQQTAHVVARTMKRQQWRDVEFAVVSEAGASVYSVSDTAKEEFPSLDVMYRGAVSIGRRVMDPLSELVKIPVRSMGIGMYQHDVNEKELMAELSHVVESCVAAVGVNSASTNRYVMEKVPGIQKRLVDQIVLARHAKRLSSRDDLRRVAGMTEVVYNQVAGFFRFPNSAEPLDNTNIHPESYGVARSVMKLFEEGGLGSADIVGVRKTNGEADGAVLRRQAGLALSALPAEPFAALAQQLKCGVETLRLVGRELMNPALDPRASLPHAGLLRKEMKEAADLVPGDRLTGIVQSITTFGAFVDCGFHENVLVRTDVDRLQVGTLLRDIVFTSRDQLGRLQVSYTPPPSPQEEGARATGGGRGETKKGLRLEAEDSVALSADGAMGLSAQLALARSAATKEKDEKQRSGGEAPVEETAGASSGSTRRGEAPQLHEPAHARKRPRDGAASAAAAMPTEQPLVAKAARMEAAEKKSGPPGAVREGRGVPSPPPPLEGKGVSVRAPTHSPRPLHEELAKHAEASSREREGQQPQPPAHAATEEEEETFTL